MSDNALARSQSIMGSLRKTVSCQIGGDQILLVCGPVKIIVVFHSRGVSNWFRPEFMWRFDALNISQLWSWREAAKPRSWSKKATEFLLRGGQTEMHQWHPVTGSGEEESRAAPWSMVSRFNQKLLGHELRIANWMVNGRTLGMLAGSICTLRMHLVFSHTN